MDKHWRVPICALVVAVTLSPAATSATPQRPDSVPQELAWIPLFNSELARWLENENQLKELCTAREGSNEWHECRAAKLEPKLTVIPVRSEPNRAARRVGEIVVLALPGHGLKAFASSGPMAVQFTPDLFDPDWGYGPPWFHQSVLGRRGSWFRIPVRSIGRGWINMEDWVVRDTLLPEGAGVSLQTLQKGDIVTTPRGDMLVLGVENRVLRVRPEQKSDMWCEGGDPPPVAPSKEIRIPFEQLLDAQGHLLIKYKYTRGC